MHSLLSVQVPTTLVPHKRSADEKSRMFETMKDTISEVRCAEQIALVYIRKPL